VFVACSAITILGLLGLTIAIALPDRGTRRLLALIPTATLAAIILYVIAGGPLMLATWLAAAAAALALPNRSSVRPAPAGP
jgi:hypothetical protein